MARPDSSSSAEGEPMTVEEALGEHLVTENVAGKGDTSGDRYADRWFYANTG